MSIPINDQPQRDRALNPQQSFIVQAPAGSGKTELLTQRFLVLLSHVKQPEEILAITFTKKSAAEMRARIIHALKNANEMPEPDSDHAKKTWRLAKQALKNNELLQWDLLDNPSRLRIQTIDSFNAGLTRQLPILSHFGATPEIADDPTLLYQEAVQEFLSHLEEDVEWADAIAQLLLHMDNDLMKVEELLINLLAKRDQWLPYIAFNSTDPELRKNLESHLASIVTDILTALHERFPKQYKEELLSLARYASESCRELTSFPGIHIQDKKYWLAFSHLLLTSEGEWRKRVDARLGFPPSSSEKTHMLTLIKNLSEDDNLLFLFRELTLSPDAFYNASQWETLNALHPILRIVVAQLKVTFQKRGKIDYIENAQAALTALGSEETPTDLTLTLDYKIQHILIDEFQDTSSSQSRLLKKLMEGWEKNDGRTLFIVGDPMQSIYRFREADVGLFIRARKIGIQHVSLEPLTLSVNFRSTPAIVHWVNKHFQEVFPPFEDISSGAVPYSHSLPHQTEESLSQSVTLHNAEKNKQAQTIVNVIHQAKKENPKGSIAILVRSRTHLENIMPALKKANIPYQAINIDPLTTRQVIQDLMALTKALLHPANRVAWLSILRAPWCGLSLADLLIIAGKNPTQLIWERLFSPDIATLSQEGQQRLARILPILSQKINERRRHPLRLWIESTWIMLGGPACVEQEMDLEDAAAFFNLLEKYDDGGELSSIDHLDEHVSKLYATTHSLDQTLQIMTIHNAKGLEFDTVILPHLECKSPPDDKQLLLWMERSRQQSNSSFILAPVHAVGEESDSIYDYIKRQNAIKTDYENGRLLYVAVTRAKKKLHLLFNAEKDKNPVSKSLLEKIWKTLEKETPQEATVSDIVIEEKNNSLKKIHRLTTAWKQSLHEIDPANIPAYQPENKEMHLPNILSQRIGSLIHQILQYICLKGTAWWQSQTLVQQKAYITSRLRQFGLLSQDLTEAIYFVENAIQNTLIDPRGQWLLKNHAEDKTEFAITAVIQEEIKQLIIDRTFIDEAGIRWIIDYKTTAIFNVDEEQKKHEQQLREYHQAISAMDQTPIRMGLYFPSIPAWREWAFVDKPPIYNKKVRL